MLGGEGGTRCCVRQTVACVGIAFLASGLAAMALGTHSAPRRR
jgi:hypothetical protein